MLKGDFSKEQKSRLSSFQLHILQFKVLIKLIKDHKLKKQLWISNSMFFPWKKEGIRVKKIRKLSNSLNN